MRALIALVFSAVLGLSGVAMTPAPAAAQYVEFGVGFGHGHGYRHHRPRYFGHHRPRHYGHRHFRHGPRYARPYYDYRGHYRPRHAWRHYGPGVDLVVPVPRYARPHYPVRRAFSHSGSHVRWCHNRYRSYRAWDNSFQPHHGGRRLCYSPYG